MKKNKAMLMENLISYYAFLLLLMPTTITGVFAVGVLLILGTVWLIWKKPNIKTGKEKRIPLILSIIIVAYLGVLFFEKWIPSSKIQGLAAAFHMSNKLLLSLASCTLSLFAIPFFLFLLKCEDEILTRFFGESPKKSLNMCFLASIATFTLSQIMSDAGILSMGLLNSVCGGILVAVVILLLFCLCGNVRASIALGTGIFMVLSTINAYVLKFRDRLFVPSDILSIRTAMNVADNYSLWPPPITVILCWVLWAGFLSFLFFTGSKEKTKLSGKTRFIIVVTCMVSVSLTIVHAKDLKIKHWENIGAITYGYILDFLSKTRELRIAKPKEYNEEVIFRLEQQYSFEQEKPQNNRKYPHIIVIMDEAFSDLSMPDGITTNTEVMPFINSMSQNALTGHVLVSVNGGNTSNSEYEFLTGNSMAWLSPNAVPYQQYLKSAPYSMVSYLKSCFGYHCVAMHPFFSNGWNRMYAYPLLGFDECYFVEDFPQKDYVREYISDRELFETVATTYENEHASPLFLFCVSMQNHGGYLYSGENYSQSIFLNGFENKYPGVEQYLSLIHETDKAVEQLISYFSNVEDDVVIVFFGDHQPGYVAKYFYGHGLDEAESLDEIQERYKVPFFIWANYEIEEELIALTSLNYLSSYVYQTAGLQLPSYNQFLSEMEKTIPAINAIGYYSQNAKAFLPFDEACEEERYWLTRYQILQYNCLFDEQNRSEVFFP